MMRSSTICTRSLASLCTTATVTKVGYGRYQILAELEPPLDF